MSRPDDTSPGSETEWRSTTRFCVEEWTVDPLDLTLRRGGEERRLEPKVMDVLLFLAQRSPEVVPRDELFQKVWEGRAVVDGVLSRAISVLRQALGDDRRLARYIETVPRRGYRLVARVEREVEGSSQGEREELHVPTPPSVPALQNGQRLQRLGRVLLVLMALGAAFWWTLRPPAPIVSATPAGPVRLAVLPLDAAGGAAEEIYLARGLTEELTHQLAVLSALRVVSRTSAVATRARGLTSPEIARQLTVDYLLEGSVLVVGEQLRVTVQLIEPRRDEHLWSRTYDRTLADLLDLQRELAVDVTTQVEAELTPPERARLAYRRSVDGEAYLLYLQALQRLERRTRVAVGEARDLLRRSVKLDPELAVAWAALGKMHLLSELYLRVPQAQAYARAQLAIDEALRLDPRLATAQVSLGLLRLSRDWDWAGAEEAYRAAIDSAPSYALAHQWLSECLSLAGRHPEAMRSIGRAAELDPLSPLVHAAWGQRLNAAGRPREALERFRAADALGAEFAWHWREAAYAYERLGEVEQALESYVERLRRRGVEGEELEALRQAVAADGLPGYWRWQYQHLARLPDSEPMLLAEALAGSGDAEAAFPWLQAAVAKRGGWFLHMVKSPAFDPLREDSRFLALVEQARP